MCAYLRTNDHSNDLHTITTKEKKEPTDDTSINVYSQ